MHIRGSPGTYRIALSTFQATGESIHSVVRSLVTKGFLAPQLCFVGKPSVIALLASSTDPNCANSCALSQFATHVEAIHPRASVASIVASVGPISDVLLKKQSWLSSPSAAPLNRRLENGDVLARGERSWS